MPRYDIICPQNHEILDFVKRIHEPFPICPTCGEQTEMLWRAASGVIGDDIPGGIVIRHFEKYPMKFHSKTDLRRAANERGLTMAGDTPKPYRVPWSGRRNDGSPPA